MTTQPPTTDQQATAYLAALVALAGGTSAAMLGLLDSVPSWAVTPELRASLSGLLATRLVVGNAQARTLASWYGAAVVSEVRGTVAAPVVSRWPHEDVARLTQAVENILTPHAAIETAANIDEALARFDAAIAPLIAEQEAAQRAADAVAEAAAKAAQAQVDAIDVEYAQRAEQAAADLARMESERIDADLARARRDLAVPLKPEVTPEERARYDEQRAQDLGRLDRLARGEVLKAAADTLRDTFADAPEVLGWVRQLNPGACPTCVAWWGSEGATFTPVRPYSVRMKRHPSCACVQRPVVYQEEFDVRGFTDRPEPVANRWKRPSDRPHDTTGNGAGG